MKKIKKCHNLTNVLNLSAYARFIPSHLLGDALFLDIETTGFTPSKSRLYLIGTAYFQNAEGGMEPGKGLLSADSTEPQKIYGTEFCAEQLFIDSQAPDKLPETELCVEQFFAEKPDEEPQLLAALGSLLCHFGTIVTFHGTQFDLPYLEGCLKRLGAECGGQHHLVYDNKDYVDLYRLSYSYRNIFMLENYKQKTIEKFLGAEREDAYSGGELIKVYKKYVKRPDDSLLQLLLLHNHEDILGMVRLLSLYAFDSFFQGGFAPAGCRLSPYRKLDGRTGKEAVISCKLPGVLPAAASCCNSHYYLHAAGDLATFRIPLYEGALKYFYPNHKDYYYLPKEDMAVHKSVASYVDKAHRVKARAENCYSKKSGVFLPQYGEATTPALYERYKAPVSYFEWDDKFSCDAMLLKNYCMHILRVLRDGK